MHAFRVEVSKYCFLLLIFSSPTGSHLPDPDPNPHQEWRVRVAVAARLVEHGVSWGFMDSWKRSPVIRSSRR